MLNQPLQLEVIMQIISSILNGPSSLPGQVQIVGDYIVNVKTLKLKTFHQQYHQCSDIKCVFCGVRASYFKLEGQPTHNKYCKKETVLLQAYAVKNNKEVIMTCDHILARAFNGQNITENTQVLCYHCNSQKSAIESRLMNNLYSILYEEQEQN